MRALTLAALGATMACVLAPGIAAAETESPQTLEEALASSARSDRPVVVDLFATWCGPCKVFDRDVERDELMQAALEDVILFRTNAEKEGRSLAQAHRILILPTFLALNADGDVLDRWSGYGGSADWVSTVESIVAEPITLAERRARFEAQPTPEDASRLARTAYSQGAAIDEVNYRMARLRLDSSHGAKEAMPLFVATARGHQSEQFTVEQVREAADLVLDNESASPHELADVARTMRKLLADASEMKLFPRYLMAALAATEHSDDVELQRVHETLRVDQALYVEKDTAEAVTRRRALLPAGWTESAAYLNEFAWWCFENRVNLREAEELARQGVELAETGQQKANVLDTVAELCNVRGDCREAVILIEQALELDPESAYLQNQRQKFQKILAEAG